jgi:hypothetical protein
MYLASAQLCWKHQGRLGCELLLEAHSATRMICRSRDLHVRARGREYNMKLRHLELRLQLTRLERLSILDLLAVVFLASILRLIWRR